MINNLHDLFIKYKSQINSKKEIENKILNIINNNLNINLENKNIKIDIKNKLFKLIGLNSSFRFFIKNKLNTKLLEEIKEKTDFILID